MKEKILNWATKFQDNVYVKAISGAMTGLLALMMVSSVATLIGAIDFWGIQEILVSTGIKSLMVQINNMTLNVISIYTAFLIAYKLGDLMDKDKLNCGIMGVMAFLILTPLTSVEGSNVFQISALGSQGMFTAMLSGVLAARLYIFLVDHNLIIKLPDAVPPIVSRGFAAIIPGCVVALLFGILYQVMLMTPYGSFSSFIYTLLQQPLTAMGSNIFTVMFIVAFIEFLWFFGVHGVMVVMPILMMVFYQPQLANLEAYASGSPLPYLFTMGFILGNRGARSLAVSLLCIFRSKSEKLKAVGKVGLIPALFGISEPIKFGIPQVMNIRMLLPLMLTPAVSVLSAYLLTIIGFLPYHNGVSLPTGFPVIINGLFTNGWQGIIAQIIQLVLCVIIYIPFIKAEDTICLEEEKNAKEAVAA